jgi:hypothetical protein
MAETLGKLDMLGYKGSAEGMTRARLDSLRAMASIGTDPQLQHASTLQLLDEVERMRTEMVKLDAIVFHQQSRGWPAYTEEERRHVAVQPDFDAQSRAVKRHMQTWTRAETCGGAPAGATEGALDAADTLAMPAGRDYIPRISPERMQSLASRISPLIRLDGALRHIRPTSIDVAFLWNPQAADEAEELEPLREIRTYHSFAYHAFFKPSIAEVLAQVPGDIEDHVTAFEIIAWPENADELNKELQALQDGFHVACTRFYGKPRL